MSELINFKKLSREYLSFLNETRNDYCEEFLHDSRKFSLEQTHEWFDKTNPSYYIIFSGEVPVGYFRISNIDLVNKNLLIGADINKNFCGKGIAYQSYKKFIPILFEMYELNKISLEVLSTNERAIHLYKKLGFVFEGIKRKEILKNGNWIDSIMMSMLREEHEKLKI